MRILNSIEDVIEELGGVKAVAELTNRTNSASVVPNWIDRKSFPRQTYAVMKAALHAKGATAPGDLWKMPEVEIVP
jgi:hypothetical protein